MAATQGSPSAVSKWSMTPATSRVTHTASEVGGLAAIPTSGFGQHPQAAIAHLRTLLPDVVASSARQRITSVSENPGG